MNTQSFPLIQVSAGILWQVQTFLATRRAKKPHAEYWEFPGGKLEPGETPLDALIRELREELAIDVRKAQLWQTLEHTYEDAGFRVRIFFFDIMTYDGEPEGVEGQSLRWLTISEAMQLPFLPADQPILTKLGALRLLNPVTQEKTVSAP